jgi:hypothetical protein
VAVTVATAATATIRSWLIQGERCFFDARSQRIAGFVRFFVIVGDER